MTSPSSANGSTPASASRAPPPMVSPVTIDGVTYKQMSGSADPDVGQVGGLVGAYDGSGQRLWWLKVYDNQRRDDIEGDVQDVFFRSMTAEPDGRLLIVNERGQRFLVDVKARTSTSAPAPESDAPAAGATPMLRKH